MSDKANPAPIASAKELEDRVKRVDEDRWLSSRYAPAGGRERLMAVYAFHYELVRALHMSEPMLGRIRVQWWREALDEIAESRPIRAHDVVQALAPILFGRMEALDAAGRMLDAFDARIDGEIADKPPLVVAGGCLAQMAGAVLGEAGTLDAGALSALAACGEAHAAAQMGEESANRLVDEARAAFAGLDVGLVPAVAHLAISTRERDRKASGIGRRWRIFRAVASGRLG